MRHLFYAFLFLKNVWKWYPYKLSRYVRLLTIWPVCWHFSSTVKPYFRTVIFTCALLFILRKIRVLLRASKTRCFSDLIFGEWRYKSSICKRYNYVSFYFHASGFHVEKLSSCEITAFTVCHDNLKVGMFCTTIPRVIRISICLGGNVKIDTWNK